MKRRQRKCSAYLTVYLSLCLSVLTSLCLALIEGARSNAIRMETECVTDIAMNSILAEYHRELFRRYNLFAIDSSYGTGQPGKSATEGHLLSYLTKNMSVKPEKLGIVGDVLYRDMLAMSPEQAELTGVSILTDEGGAVFRGLAADVIEDDMGVTALKELDGWLQVVEAYSMNTRDVAAEKAKIDQEIREYEGAVSEQETDQEASGSPTKELDEKRKTGILSMVLKDTEELSGRSMAQDGLVYSRMRQGKVNTGNRRAVKPTEEEALAEALLFQEYLVRYMGHYGSEAKEGALAYQLEYLLIGKDSDRENLEGTANALCALREAANAAYIVTDQVKREEAEFVATLLSAALMIPECKDLITASILLGWAYAESLYDVKQLLAGQRVPLMKESATWHYSLEGALLGLLDEENAAEIGLSYEDYLRILLCLSDQDLLTGRAMNIVEADIRQTAGNSAFRLDGCFARIEADIKVRSKYGYRFEIIREKGY